MSDLFFNTSYSQHLLSHSISLFRYKRVFSVGTLGITTYNPTTMEITNQWPYNEVVGVVPNAKGQLNNEFIIITLKKGGKKTDNMKFSSDHRSEILTASLVY